MTALYIPTKCQNLQRQASGSRLTGEACAELTVSTGCQNWVTTGGSTPRRSAAEPQPKGKSRRAVQKNGGRKIFNAENTEECRETQSGKVAERNSLSAEAQRGKVSNQRGKSRR